MFVDLHENKKRYLVVCIFLGSLYLLHTLDL